MKWAIIGVSETQTARHERVLTCFTLVHLFAIAGLWPPLNNYFVFGIVFTSLYFVLNYRDENFGEYIDFVVTLNCKY